MGDILSAVVQNAVCIMHEITHTQAWIYALWVWLCIYTFNLNESDFPHSEQKMAKHFTFQSMVPAVLNTWEVFLCLTYFKAMQSDLFSLLVSVPSFTVFSIVNILSFGPFNTFVCSNMVCMCAYARVVPVHVMKIRGQFQVPFLCTWSILGFFGFILFSTGFLIGLKFSSLAMLAGQWASASFLSLSLHFGDYKHASSSPAFYVHSGDQTQVLMLA